MRASLAFLAGAAFFSTATYAEFRSVVIKPESEYALPAICVGSKSEIQLKGERISVVKASGEGYNLGLDEQLEDLSIFFGSYKSSDVCTLAIKYAENDVNESFSLFVFKEDTDQFKASAVRMISNPDFTDDIIRSSYNEGPVTHNDQLCFSRAIKDYYFCEKREQFAEKLEKRQRCDESFCSDSEIVNEGTSEQVIAVIAASKAYLSDKSDDSKFILRRAYLVKGDQVLLSDFFQGDDELYYKVIYAGKTKTVGWVPASLLHIKH